MRTGFPLRDPIAFLTGGASGIGRALGEELARRGARVVLADRQEELAAEVARHIEAAGGSASAVALDVRSAEAFARVIEEIGRSLGPVDLLFNNAGIGAGGSILDYDLEDWTEVLDVNLRGVVHGIEAVYPQMVARRSGHIVNTASVAGLVAMPGLGSYTTSKHAVVGLTKALRLEAREHGVRASVLCPGLIRTPLIKGGVYGRVKSERDQARMDLLADQMRAMEPAPFARRVVDAVERNVAVIIVPGWWRLFWYLERLSPSLSLALAGWLYRRTERQLDERS